MDLPGIVVQGHNYLRISVQLYVTKAMVDHFIACLKVELGKNKKGIF